MKLRNSILLTAFAILIIATQACKKKPTPPTPGPQPPVVTTPSFSFTALGITATGVQYTITNPNAGPFQVTGSNASTNSNYQTVVITVGSAVNAAGTFTLNTTASNNSNNGVYTSGSNTIMYNTNSTHTGTITFSKVDMVNHLMSASFNFSAQEYNPNNGSSGTISGSFTNVSF